ALELIAYIMIKITACVSPRYGFPTPGRDTRIALIFYSDPPQRAPIPYRNTVINLSSRQA
ncbi:MAG: hypothetical protein AAGD96_35205, partial [Chloroflexota bacterium]